MSGSTLVENRNCRGKPPSHPQEPNQRRRQPSPRASPLCASPLAFGSLLPFRRCAPSLRAGLKTEPKESVPELSGGREKLLPNQRLPRAQRRYAPGIERKARLSPPESLPDALNRPKSRKTNLGGTRYFSALEPISDALRGYDVGSVGQ